MPPTALHSLDSQLILFRYSDFNVLTTCIDHEVTLDKFGVLKITLRYTQPERAILSYKHASVFPETMK